MALWFIQRVNLWEESVLTSFLLLCGMILKINARIDFKHYTVLKSHGCVRRGCNLNLLLMNGFNSKRNIDWFAGCLC